MRIHQINFIWIVLAMVSCKAYKQDILFKLDEGFGMNDLSKAASFVERNYIIQINDRIKLNVFTNKGELIVDPNFELTQNVNQQGVRRQELDYLVMIDSTAKFPIIGQVKVEGLTINEAEQVLQKRYDEYYTDSFVRLEFNNKRVIVLGANGGQVIPLAEQNLSLIEVIALAGGVQQGAKSQNIKLIRGDLQDPEVFQIDLSTINGMTGSILEIQPGDIIYIEPWRRPFIDGIRDISPVLSLITSTLALALVLQNLSN